MIMVSVSFLFLSLLQQSIELYLHEQYTNSTSYVSDEADVPVGEFDGQLVIGSSYIYPVKKFLVEQDGDIVTLEFDLSKLDTQGLGNIEVGVVKLRGVYL